MNNSLDGFSGITFLQDDAQLVGVFFLVVLILVVWEIIWKGIALWHSAQAGQKGWFVAILLLNTIGILPIVYLLMHRNTVSGKKL